MTGICKRSAESFRDFLTENKRLRQQVIDTKEELEQRDRELDTMKEEIKALKIYISSYKQVTHLVFIDNISRFG